MVFTASRSPSQAGYQREIRQNPAGRGTLCPM